MYTPNQVTFKDCTFINKLEYNLFLHNISPNELFNPLFFAVKLLFTSDSAFKFFTEDLVGVFNYTICFFLQSLSEYPKW